MQRLLFTALACLLSISLFSQNEYSLSFDGGNSVEIADVNSSLDDISSEITIEANIYIHEIPNGNHSRIVHRSEGVGGVSNRYGFSITPIQAGNGKLELWIENIAGIQSSYSLNLNQWYHVAGVYDGNHMSVFVDGQIAGFTEASGSFQVDDWPFWIGSANGNSHFNGKIDNVRIWNQALSEEMLSQYSNCPPSGDEEGLVGYWDFEEGIGNNVIDISGNGNNGTINGASWSTESPDQDCIDNVCGIDGAIEIEAFMYGYEPQNLSIDIGQTVAWSNIEGYHDVNGNINSITGNVFDNPESFYLNPSSGSSSNPTCIGSYTFSIPGIYSYDCSIGNHAAQGMVGTITVGVPGCNDEEACNYNPSSDFDNGSCEYITPVDLGDDIETCDESVTLDAGPGYDSYQWSTGETTQTIEVNESGDYSVEVENTWGNTLPVYIPSDGLVAWWPFNGNALDESGNDNNGSIVNAELTTDRFGNTESAFSFNGQNQSISSNNSPFNFNEDFTISMWCESHSLQNNQTIINSNPHPVLTLNYNYQSAPTESIMLLYGDGISWINNTSENIVLPAGSIQNQWMHIVLSKEDGVWKFYENNNLIHGFNEISSLFNEDVGISLGKCGSICNEFFNGKIDDFAFWNRALNPEEIINLFNAENSCFSSDQINVTFNNSGCTDESACNFNVEAVCNDGSCEYITPVDLGDDIETCDESVTLDAGPGYDSYQWSNGETTQSIEVNETGDYSVEVENGVNSNSSLSFDGDEDYVLVENNSNSLFELSNTITLSAWVRANELQNAQIAGSMDFNCSDGDGYRLNLRSNGNIWAGFGCYPSADFALGTNAYNPNEWIYVTGVFKENDYLKLYVNGVLQDSISHTRSFSNHSSDFYIGAGNPDQYPNYENFNGFISEVIRWNIELDQDQIIQYMNCSPLGDEEGIVGYWNFENNSDENQAFDSSINNNNGLINGAVYSNEIQQQTCPNCGYVDDVAVVFNTEGCTDLNACNYAPEAVCDDGSCVQFDECGECGGNGTLGCTDSAAFNYDPEADCDDGSCVILGCIDQDAANYNNEANQDDGSCLYDINYVNDAFNDGVNSVECPPCDNDCPGDYTGDGLVSVGDLLEFLILFGNQCE